jgi:DNA-binding PadR family transcriptional regulator
MRSSASNGFDIWGAVDGLRDTLGGGWRSGPDDIRTAILVSLLAEPMHGYQVIQAIEARTGWKPSPGEVYPTLQLLADEQLVTAELVGERKVYTLTEAGTSAAESAGEPAEAGESRHARLERGLALPKAGAKLAQAAALVAQSGTAEQAERAVAAIDEARRTLYAILAED